MKIYFAGSIRGGRDDSALYQSIIKLLSQYGAVLTEHVGNKKLSAMGDQKASEDIYERDMSWLRESDFVVAEVTTPSLGVGYELAKAEEMGKKIICIHRPTPGRRLSAMIGGNKGFTVVEYNSIGELERVFEKFFK